MGHIEPTDEQLADAVASDPDAFTRLYRRYERPLLGYFAGRTASAELAADLTAETFAAALVSLNRGVRIEHGFGRWLFGVAQHKLVDSRRRGRVEDEARRRLEMQPIELRDDAVEAIEALAGRELVDDLLAALPADQREAIAARVLEDRTYAELAAALECSEMVVRKRVSRGLGALRSQIQEQRP